jgi:hypothetical protein
MRIDMWVIFIAIVFGVGSNVLSPGSSLALSFGPPLATVIATQDSSLSSRCALEPIGQQGLGHRAHFIVGRRAIDFGDDIEMRVGQP